MLETNVAVTLLGAARSVVALTVALGTESPAALVAMTR